jgi:hypothetical protein
VSRPDGLCSIQTSTDELRVRNRDREKGAADCLFFVARVPTAVVHFGVSIVLLHLGRVVNVIHAARILVGVPQTTLASAAALRYATGRSLD